jgi:hypothetical protein
MRPIQSDSSVAFEAGQRCIARAAYALDIGGVRSRETVAIVRRVVAARDYVDGGCLVRRIDLPIRGVMVRVTCALAPAAPDVGLPAHPFVVHAVADDGVIFYLTRDEVRAIRPALERLFLEE